MKFESEYNNFIQEKEFENVVGKIVAIWFKPFFFTNFQKNLLSMLSDPWPFISTCITINPNFDKLSHVPKHVW